MSTSSVLTFALALAVVLPLGDALVIDPLLPRQGAITPLSQSEIDSFNPYAWYASTAYCEPSTTATWSCGANCEANADFQVTASGGDGAVVQFWYVGYDPGLHSVIVGHQGTDPSKIIPIVTDLNFFLMPLNPTLFPGIPAGVLVHSGFKVAQELTASDILENVNKTMHEKGTNAVTVVGHSLGAAISMIDAVYLDLQLPDATVTMKGFGSPRVGNPAFATYVDNHLTSASRVNNKRDPVPILPDRAMGFSHPNGEIHIKEDGVWVSCPGHDNTDPQCTTGDTNIIINDPSDHMGPYNGINMGC